MNIWVAPTSQYRKGGEDGVHDIHDNKGELLIVDFFHVLCMVLVQKKGEYVGKALGMNVKRPVLPCT